MNFSTKTLEEISTIVAEEIDRQIETEEIKDIQGLENGIREMLKGAGAQAYGKVLEKEDQKLGKRVGCECGGQAQWILKRDARVMSVFGWVCYRRSYYGCGRCGEKQNCFDTLSRLPLAT